MISYSQHFLQQLAVRHIRVELVADTLNISFIEELAQRTPMNG